MSIRFQAMASTSVRFYFMLIIYFLFCSAFFVFVCFKPFVYLFSQECTISSDCPEGSFCEEFRFGHNVTLCLPHQKENDL